MLSKIDRFKLSISTNRYFYNTLRTPFHERLDSFYQVQNIKDMIDYTLDKYEIREIYSYIHCILQSVTNLSESGFDDQMYRTMFEYLLSSIVINGNISYNEISPHLRFVSAPDATEFMQNLIDSGYDFSGCQELGEPLTYESAIYDNTEISDDTHIPYELDYMYVLATTDDTDVSSTCITPMEFYKDGGLLDEIRKL